MLYKFIIIIVNFLILENVFALESSLDNNKVSTIYVVGSSLGHDLHNNHKYEFFNVLRKKYNIINLSIPKISIYDQLNLLDNISNFNQTNDKIIFLLENFYLESIFFEINFIKSLCNNRVKCKKFDFIPYTKLYLPLIEILHRRIESYFSFTDMNNVLFLVDNTKLYQTKYSIKNLVNINKIDYFNLKKNYCVISEIDINTKKPYNCLIFKLL